MTKKEILQAICATGLIILCLMAAFSI